MKKKIISSILLVGILFLFQTKVFSQEKPINTSYHKMGIDSNGIQNIKNILLDNGIEQKNIEAVKRCIITIAKDIPNGSREFELSDTIKNHLKEISVKPSQIGIIKRIALRISLMQSKQNSR